MDLRVKPGGQNGVKIKLFHRKAVLYALPSSLRKRTISNERVIRFSWHFTCYTLLSKKTAHKKASQLGSMFFLSQLESACRTAFLCNSFVLSSCRTLLYTVNSLNRHLSKTNTWCWSHPCRFQSFYCNLTPYKTDTSQRQTDGASPDDVRFRELTVKNFKNQ